MMRVSELIDAARTLSGLDDFGCDSFREGLEVLVTSLDREAAMSDQGREIMSGQIIGFLTNRLEIEEWYRRHPEIDDQQVTAPVFVLGLPRTGSTALGALLAQDPGVRTLRIWEATKPCPPPEAATAHDDPRIAEAQVRLDRQDKLAPSLKSMVPVSATGPTECLQVLAFDFRSGTFEGIARIPTYSAWLLDCDMEPAYAYHKRVLKLLQWRCPPTRWRLRTPAHMYAIDALDRVYPDGRFVMTHRDVASVIPSVASLMTTLASMVTDQPDQHYFGAQSASVWETALRRTMVFREAGQEDRFSDIGFSDMQSDPIGSVRRLYRSLGEELTPAAEERMRAWSANNSRGKHGSHTYIAEDFGLSAEELRARFAFYTQRFEIPHDS